MGPQAKNVRLHIIPTVDSWIRDYGPNFVVHDDGRVAFNDFGFNAWGGKYETLKADSRVPSCSRRSSACRVSGDGVVLEGGSIDVNGAGVVMTTEQCLLNVNRNPGMSRAEIERVLCDYLGERTCCGSAKASPVTIPTVTSTTSRDSPMNDDRVRDGRGSGGCESSHPGRQRSPSELARDATVGLIASSLFPCLGR